MSGTRTTRAQSLSCLLVLACAACAPAPPAAPDHPDVLLITLDTCRADHLGCYGYPHPTSPNIDALAARGTLFERAYAVTPTTLPSHASILTGLAPPSHGVRDNLLFRLPEAATTVAEVFQGQGYRTGAVLAASVLLSRHGLDQGFEHYDEEGLAERVIRRADDVTDRALRWLAQDDGRPWFLWVHYFDAHHPYRPPSPFAEQHPGRPYDGSIASMDHQLGRLLEAVAGEDAGAAPLVAVTGDHGESLGEHGESYHSVFLYDATLHVPLILAGPGVPAGRRVSTMVTNRDLAATLVAGAGFDPLALSDEGRPLGQVPPRVAIYAESLTPAIRYGWAPLRSVRTLDALFVDAPRPELYSVPQDPGQLTNLLDRDPNPDLAELYHALLWNLHDDFPPLEQDARAAPASEEELRQLEQLGYLLRDADPDRAGGRGAPDPKDRIQVVELLYQGQAHFQGGRLDQAEAAWQAAADQDPKNVTVWMNLGAVHYVRNHLGKAAHAYERALKLRPEDWVLLSELGQVRLAQGQWDEAERLLQEARGRAPLTDTIDRRLELVRQRRADQER